jgi:hypothetical protein
MRRPVRLATIPAAEGQKIGSAGRCRLCTDEIRQQLHMDVFFSFAGLRTVSLHFNVFGGGKSQWRLCRRDLGGLRRDGGVVRCRSMVTRLSRDFYYNVRCNRLLAAISISHTNGHDLPGNDRQRHGNLFVFACLKTDWICAA